MKSRFNIPNMLQSLVSYKGLPFPLAVSSPQAIDSYDGYRRDYKLPTKKAGELRTTKGVPIYKQDMMGRWYFMPVSFHHLRKNYEIDCALVSISQAKKIIKTDVVGKRGTVKELISLQDLEISIKGAIVGDGCFPEAEIKQFNELWRINEAVDLSCAISSLFMEDNDKVVITNFSMPEQNKSEHVQLVSLKCVSDAPFELIIE